MVIGARVYILIKKHIDNWMLNESRRITIQCKICENEIKPGIFKFFLLYYCRQKLEQGSLIHAMQIFLLLVLKTQKIGKKSGNTAVT